MSEAALHDHAAVRRPETTWLAWIFSRRARLVKKYHELCDEGPRGTPKVILTNGDQRPVVSPPEGDDDTWTLSDGRRVPTSEIEVLDSARELGGYST